MKYHELGCQSYCQNTILDSIEKKYDSKNGLISSRHVVHTYRGCADGYDPFQYDQITEFCDDYYCEIDLPVFNDACYPIVTTTTTTKAKTTTSTAPTAPPTTTTTSATPVTTELPIDPKGIQIGLIVTSIMSVILMIISLITVWNHRKIKKKLEFHKTYNNAIKNAPIGTMQKMNINWHDGNTTVTNMSATSSTWWSTKFVWWFQYWKTTVLKEPKCAQSLHM